MNVTILNSDPAGHWLSVHRTGCADLSRGRVRSADQSWTEDHDTLIEVAESIACDFIGEGSMTIEEAVNEHVYFYPCVDLPRGQAS